MSEWVEKNLMQILYAILFLCVIVPLLAPQIPVPIQIDWWTQDAFDVIEGLEPDDVVWVQNEMAGQAYGAFQTVAEDVLYHIFTRPGVKILIGSVRVSDGPPVFNTAVLPYFDKSDKVYGEDYALFGYFPGTASAVASFASSVKGLLQVDYYGNTGDTLSVLDEITDGSDISLVIILGRPVGVNEVWAPEYPDTPVLYCYTTAVVGEAVSGIARGIYAGGVFDVVGSSQYEVLLTNAGLTGHNGKGIKGFSATNVVNVYLVVLIVIGNLVMIYKKVRGE